MDEGVGVLSCDETVMAWTERDFETTRMFLVSNQVRIKTA